MHRFLRNSTALVAVSAFAVVTGGGLLASSARGDAAVKVSAYSRVDEAPQYKALIDRYCAACHNAKLTTAGVNLKDADLAQAPAQAELWEKVIKKLRGRMMPPPGMAHPDETTTNGLTGWLEGYLDYAAAAQPRDPGQVSIHRLNRREYANAVHDLLAVDISPKALLPQDEVADGFDNVADALQVSPSFLDQYISAARTVAVQAIGRRAPRPASVPYFSNADAKPNEYVEGLPLGTRGGILARHNFPTDGEYELSVNDMIGGLYSLNQDFEHKIVVLLDGSKIYETAIGGEADAKAVDQKQAPAVDAINARLKKIKFKATAGPHELGVTFVARSLAESNSQLQPLVPGGGMDRIPRVNTIEIRGPFNPAGISDTPSRRQIFTCYPKAPSEEAACADKIVDRIARRAYRRPLSALEMTEIRKFYRAGAQRAGFEEGIRSAITRILASPEFLYRAERDPPRLPAGAVHRVSDLELASRLSFFLWSNLPDDELLNVAISGKLSRPEVLEAQVKRMLADPKAATLVSSFAFQWLQVDKIDDVAADARVFPNVAKQRDSDPDLRDSMKEELRLFIGDIFRNDRSIIDLLTADDSYLNERLALHYGVKDIKGGRFRHVKLPMPERRGLLGKAAILMETSYPNRTSPVLRGAWILENIVGTPPNPPPPGIPSLKEPNAGQAVTTMRERMAQHRANPSCNVCHGVMDPLGLALENFDAVGVWRVRDRFAASDIDASGVLPTGTKINGPNDLRDALAARPEQFGQTFIRKLTTYAVSRQLTHQDMPTIRALNATAASNDYRFVPIVLSIVKSDLFQMRTKRRDEPPAQPKLQVASAASAPTRPESGEKR